MLRNNLKPVQAARHFGVSTQRFNGWKGRGQVSADASDAVLEAMQSLDAENGHSPNHLGTFNSGNSPIAATIREQINIRVPIVGHTQAGPNIEWVELGYPTGWGEEYFELLCPDPNAYGLIVKGNSMHPKYSEGEAVCVAPNKDAVPGDCVVLKQTDGSVMLKVFASCNNKRYVFESINNGHGPLVVHEDEIEFMHYVYAGLPRSAIRHV